MAIIKLSSLYVVSWCDPAGGSNPLAATQFRRSRASVVTIGQDEIERIFILEAWGKRVPPDQLIDKICETQMRWHPAVFGIDATGPQLMFAQTVQKEIRDRGIRMTLRPQALRTDKTFSIETTIQPVVANGRLFRLPEAECKTLRDEWMVFPDGHYRDVLDALACAIRLLPTSLPAHLRQMERNQLKRYLERSGMTREQVQLRLEQHAQYQERPHAAGQ